MKRGSAQTIIVIIFIAIVITVFVILDIQMNNRPNDVLLSPTIPPIPMDCSDAIIKVVWDSIFIESSSGITIFTNDSTPGKCGGFFAYKINGENAYLLTGIDGPTGFFNLTMISTVWGNFTPEFLSTLSGITSLNDAIDYNLLTNSLGSPVYLSSRLRNINLTEADLEFRSLFKPVPSNWSTNYSGSDSINQFADNETIENTTQVSAGVVSSNRTYDSFIYLKIVPDFSIFQPACIPNWTKRNTSCQSNERNTFYYTDENYCNNETGIPPNETLICDHDSNGIIGNLTFKSNSNIDLAVYIDSHPGNLSQVYNISRLVEFREGNIIRVAFNYSFSTPLNTEGITIKKQDSSSNFGYLIVSGLDITKIVVVDRVNRSNLVCVKDADIEEIESFSANCTSGNEYIVSCPGSNSGYSCSIIDDKLVVSGITHSGVKEMASVTPTTCNSSWTNCTEWTTCELNSQTRTCHDQNRCNNSARIEIQACTPPCTSNWNCSEFRECLENSTQIKTCTDLNGCGVENTRTESQPCEFKPKKDNLMIILLVALGVIILAIIVIMAVLFLKNRKEEEKEKVKVFLDKKPVTQYGYSEK